MSFLYSLSFGLVKHRESSQLLSCFVQILLLWVRVFVLKIHIALKSEL